MLGKNYNHPSVFHKNFQRINGQKINHSFVGITKIHEYAADSCLTFKKFIKKVYKKSSHQKAFVLDTRTLFSKTS